MSPQLQTVPHLTKTIDKRNAWCARSANGRITCNLSPLSLSINQYMLSWV